MIVNYKTNFKDKNLTKESKMGFAITYESERWITRTWIQKSCSFWTMIVAENFKSVTDRKEVDQINFVKSEKKSNGNWLMFNQGECIDNLLLWDCCLVHTEGWPGVFETRWISKLSF